VKRALFFLVIALCACNGNEKSAQNDGHARPNPSAEERRLSPKETLDTVVGGVATEIVYCRPSARGRRMLGGNNPFGEVWRTGANEATTVEFHDDVLVEGQPLPEGKYALFSIPGEDEWKIIFNTVYDQWGAYNYDSAKDALRVTVVPQKRDAFTETFTITPDDDTIALRWEHFYVPFRVEKASQASR